MGSSFHATTVNGPFGDPSVYVRIFREKRALLFDVGDVTCLSPGNLLKVSDVFVTHTHIDHFIGFDTLLRVSLRRDAPLRLFGPPGITDCVTGKLRGYTWNLIDEYPLRLEVYEVRERVLSLTEFSAREGLRPLARPDTLFDGLLLRESFLTVKAIMLTHDIPVMAYSLEEDYHINIDKGLLARRALPVGPWLSDLKKAVRRGLQDDTVFEVSGEMWRLGDLRPIAVITKGQKLSYVVDVSPTDDNLQKAVSFVRGSDILFCEAYFLDEDRQRARERNHLTAAMAGRIAREAGVGALVLTHFSPKYRSAPEALYREAAREFCGPVR